MHTKHPKISRKTLGYYSCAEFALLGTSCERIEDYMAQWLAALAPLGRLLGVTGDHAAAAHAWQQQWESKQFFGPQAAWNTYDDRLLGADYDLVLVNGNHYPAQRQVVFIDPVKAGTLERRRQQLTDVAAIIFCPGAEATLPKWLVEDLAQQPQPLICELAAATETLLPLLQAELAQQRPSVKALILTGGKSSRMGSDKASLIYRSSQAEAQRLASICQGLGLPTYFSVASAAASSFEPAIPDRFLGLGPMGAIASAFLQEPQTAWLVLACDLPLLEASHIAALLAARAPDRYATAAQGAAQEFPEPLIAIYEPRAYGRLLQFLSLGYACPRKMLINSDIATLLFTDESPLTNANTPADRAAVQQLLQGGE